MYRPFKTVELENGVVLLVAVPGFGGRIISLIDKRSDREWLAQGNPPAEQATECSVFGGDVAAGWDECLPTVAIAVDPVDPCRQLRDHGDVWGRPTEVELDGDCLALASAVDHWRYQFGRTIRLDDASLRVDYWIENRSTRDLPFLWVMHALLDLEPGASLHVRQVERVSLSYSAGSDLIAPAELAWPLAQTVKASWT